MQLILIIGCDQTQSFYELDERAMMKSNIHSHGESGMGKKVDLTKSSLCIDLDIW